MRDLWEYGSDIDTADTPATDADELDTTVVCPVCRRAMRICYAAAIDAGDWPICHGHLMEAVATDLDAGRVARGG